MKKISLKIIYFLTLISTVFIFLFSSIITISDAQGAIIYIFTLPIMGIFILASWFCGKKLNSSKFQKISIISGILLFLFFISAFIPGLNNISTSYMKLVSKSFEFFMRKTPYVYFKEKNSFSNVLANEFSELKVNKINFDSLQVNFAWDKVCIFSPYSNNEIAKNITGIDFKIEERSKISTSDSINTYVFIYQNKVNNVIDLSRSFLDFKNANKCFERNQTTFEFEIDHTGRKTIL